MCNLSNLIYGHVIVAIVLIGNYDGRKITSNYDQELEMGSASAA